MADFSWEHHDGVATIKLNKAPANTLTVDFMSEITAVVSNMSSAPAGVRPKAIVLESSVANQFSQGIDPLAIINGTLDDRKRIFLTLGNLVEALWFSYIPVVTVVSGPALAGGAVLAMIGDLILMDAHSSKICFSEVKVGLPVPGFIQRLLQVKTSPAYWTEMLVLGKNINAHDAQKIGIANGVYNGDEERSQLLEQYLGKILRLSPSVLSETLRQSRSHERHWLESFREDLGTFATFLTDEFIGNALRQVMDGKSPKFSV